MPKNNNAINTDPVYPPLSSAAMKRRAEDAATKKEEEVKRQALELRPEFPLLKKIVAPSPSPKIVMLQHLVILPTTGEVLEIKTTPTSPERELLPGWSETRLADWAAQEPDQDRWPEEALAAARTLRGPNYRSKKKYRLKTSSGSIARFWLPP